MFTKVFELQFYSIRKTFFSGSNDPDDLIVAAFKAYEEEDRKVSAEKFR